MSVISPAAKPTRTQSVPDALNMVQTLPPVQLAQREQFLVDLCRGQRVIHVGFADEGMRTAARHVGGWLHARLGVVARELVGVDLEHAGVDDARELGYEAYVADCCNRQELRRLELPPADVVVAGEILEHVYAAGPFLDGLHELVTPQGRMVITTPNANRLLHLFATATGRELVHPDHVQIFTWYTLTNLLGRHGWQVEDFRTYLWPRLDAAAGSPGWKWGSVDRLQRLASRHVSPFFADGLIAVCRPRRERQGK